MRRRGPGLRGALGHDYVRGRHLAVRRVGWKPLAPGRFTQRVAIDAAAPQPATG
jgi:hypothetical protein